MQFLKLRSMTNGLPEPPDIDLISLLPCPMSTYDTSRSVSSITANHITSTMS